MNIPILRLDNLSRAYGDIRAVDSISLEIEKGEFVSLLGPSGSGKTTTLMMIAGLITPSSGKIVLAGRDVTAVPPYQRNLGMVFQSYALFPHMTVWQNLAFPLEMRKVARKEIAFRIDESLALVGLEGAGTRYPKQLSGGQQQRVALARALIYKPPVLLMDEPLGALDKKLRMQMQLEIKRLHRELNTTILYVTHDQEEALTMSDRIVVFNHGQLAQIGSPAALYENPTSEFVADFVGMTTLMKGRVIEVNGASCKVDLGSKTIVVNALKSIPIGAQVTISVRPERIRRLELEDPHWKDGLEGRVAESVYLGGMRQLLVRIENGPEILVTEQITTSSSCAPSIGDSVRLRWNPNDAMVLNHD